MAVLLVVIGCITAAGEPASGGVLPPDDSVQSSDGIKQSIRDFAAASGESVTAEDVVSFLDQHIQQAPAAGDGAGDQISFSSEQRFSFARASYISAAALSSSEFVVAYCDWGNSYRGTAVVGEVSGTDITFGSEYVFNSANTWYISAAGLSPSAFVVAYQDMGNSDYGTAVIGEVSGTAITFGSEYVFNSDDTDSISAAGLSSTKFVVAYRDWGNSLYGTAVVGDVSGTAITFGSEYVFNSDATYYISAAALSSTEFVVAYSDAGSSDYGTAVVGDVSGTAITFGSEYVFNSDITNDISAAALSSSAFVVAYRDEGNSWYGTAVVGDVSGTAITFGSEYVFNSDITYYISAAALSSSKFVVAYHDWGGSDYGTAVIGDVSGTAITFGTEYVFNLAGTSYISVAVLSSSEFVVAYRDAGNFNYGTAVVGDVSGTAITFGTEYVFNFGPTSYISAAALSSSKFVVAYSDAGSSNRGTAIVGDVSGTAITFGSEYVFNLAGTSYISAAALSSSKFVVAYRDAGDSNYGTAVVGIVVSGTAINFGSERFFHSNPTSYISAAALSSSKFVVAYRDAFSYGTAVVGDVSGTTVITFGSHYVFNFGSTYAISAAALSSTKFVVAYWDDGNSGYGTAVVGDVSGTAITFGSEYVFNSAGTNYISVAVLSSSEFVVAYCDGGNFNYGTAVVGDVSGTAITFGSEYVFNFGSTYDISAIGLSSSEFVVAYRDAGNFDYGTAVVGDVNGTAIGFGSEYVFNFGPTSYISAVGLSSTEFVVAYRDAGSFDYGTAVIGTVRRTRTLTVSSTTGGSVTTPGEGVFQYDYNDVVPIAAEPNAHYGFVEWTGTAVDAGKVADPCAASTTVTIHGNYTLIANFAIDQHALTVSSSPYGSVTTPGEGVFQYDYNDVVPIVAEPNAGYHLVEWMGTAVDAGRVADPRAATTTVTMHGDYTLVANFAWTIIYVDADAMGANDGSSWADAYKYLQDGLDAAEYGSDILVAEGTYQPDQGGGKDPNDREATFRLITGVALYGGYAGYGEPDPNERDIELYETILSGDLDGNDVQGLDPCDLLDHPSRADNSYHVVTGSGTDANAVLDGFTITAGNANGSGSRQMGGGMYNAQSSPTITNCTFSGNSADYGGGMDNFDNSSPTLTNCTFSGNLAKILGGGMDNFDNSSPTITNCTFSGNSADCGGGMDNDYYSNPVVTNCTFSGNWAVNSGGGMYNYDSNPTVTNCILWGNTDSGGSDESAQIYNPGSTPVVNYCCIQGWTGGLGGTGNIGDDPLFVEPNGLDGIAGTEDDDLRLSWDSNCIDAGDNNSVPADIADLDGDGNTVEPIPFDLDGNPRILNSIVDMGAYECLSPIFVDSNAPGANDGTSWANAYNYLQDALMDASSNPDVNDIWVAEGTYKPDQGGGQDPNDRDATFQLINGVGIYGGFAGGESNLNERDWITYETILSGDINTADVNTDNSYHVVTGSGTDATTILDGFTITAGYADGESPDNRGGGMYNAFGSPTVTNCTFSGNSANTGGGMRNSYSNSDVTNCTFGGNSANYGGGMYIYSSDTTVTNCTFTGNSANYGGGMYNIAISSPTVTNCTFSGNSAVFSGGGMSNTGESTAQVVNCTFSGNTAFNAGGGLANSSSSEPNITNCILWGNTASIGAQIYDDGTSSTTVSYSDVQGGWTGATNIGDDPMFKDADGADGIAGTEDDDLRLSWDSNCIDAGDNNSVPADILDLDNDGNTVEPLPFDLDSRNRFADGDCNGTEIVDMGAYEFAWIYIGDFAGGCDVDFFDFSVLGLTWMLEEGEAGYDPNCDISIPADKYIDWWDVDIFGKNWLAGK